MGTILFFWCLEHAAEIVGSVVLIGALIWEEGAARGFFGWNRQVRFRRLLVAQERAPVVREALSFWK